MTLKTKKLLEGTAKNIEEDKNVGKAPNLEITEPALFYCNIADNGYQNDSRVLFTFVPN